MKQDELRRALSEEGLDLVVTIDLEQARHSLARRLNALADRADRQQAMTLVAATGC